MFGRSVFVGVLAGCLFPMAASASTISSDGNLVTFGSGSAASDLVAQVWPSRTYLDAGDRLVAGAGCQPGPPVTCNGSRLQLTLGGGDDRAKAAALDFISGTGGSGDDQIYSWSTSGTFHGNGGDDVILQDVDGAAWTFGDAGDDALYGHGAGTMLDGGAGNDLMVGDAGQEELYGGSGADVLSSAAAAGSGPMSGGAGNDVLVAPNQTYPSWWVLDGGAGGDLIRGSNGTDTVDAGTGNDVVDVSGDPATDTVSCGSGHDTVYADVGDSISADCEGVHVGAMPPSPTLAAALARIDKLGSTFLAMSPVALAPGPLPGF